MMTGSSGILAKLPPSNVPWYKQRHLRRLNFILLSLILFSASNGYDASLMNGLQALDHWQSFMEFPTGAWFGFINAALSIASFITLPIAAWISNKFGRKIGLGIGFVWIAAGVAVQVVAPRPWVFVLGRAINGIALSFFTYSPVLVAELAEPRQRGVATAMFNCAWYIGK